MRKIRFFIIEQASLWFLALVLAAISGLLRHPDIAVWWGFMKMVNERPIMEINVPVMDLECVLAGDDIIMLSVTIAAMAVVLIAYNVSEIVSFIREARRHNRILALRCR